MKGELPEIGQEIVTKMGKAKIVGRNIVKETLVAELETGVTLEVPVSEAVLATPRRQPGK